MPKVEVILTSNIVGLGAESDQVKVNPGYARNFLLPQGLAIPLTAGNKKRLESLRRRRAEREAHDLNTMMELSKSLSKMVLTIMVRAGDDGKMFGSVTSGTIADELKQQFDIGIDKRKIHLELPIRTVGEHEVEMRLHPEVHTVLKVVVNTPTPPPAPAVPEGDKKDDRREARGDRRPRPERRDRPSKPA